LKNFFLGEISLDEEMYSRDIEKNYIMAKDLRLRIFEFAVSVAKLILQLPNSQINCNYFGQLIRSSSSTGANYRAARRAKSNRDFINKLKIVEEESDESLYFLELLMALNPNHIHLIEPLHSEGTETLKIIVASIKTAKSRAETPSPIK
jgi:four helix bundle protein